MIRNTYLARSFFSKNSREAVGKILVPVLGVFAALGVLIWVSTAEDEATNLARKVFGNPSIPDGSEEHCRAFGTFAVVGGANSIVIIVVAGIRAAILGLSCDLVANVAFAQRSGRGWFQDRGRKDA